MTTQDRRAPPIRHRRSSQLRRNIVLNVDLNAAPPGENRDEEGTSIHVVSGNTTHGQRGASSTPAAIDVEALDDDVIILSPRAFAAVCMSPLVKEMSTKCGHIFFKACIKASIAAQGKCPSRRRKIAMKDKRKVYLHATG